MGCYLNVLDKPYYYPIISQLTIYIRIENENLYTYLSPEIESESNPCSLNKSRYFLDVAD